MDDWSTALLYILALGALVMALRAHAKAVAQGSRIFALKAKVEGLEAQLAEVRGGAVAAAAPAEAPLVASVSETEEAQTPPSVVPPVEEPSHGPRIPQTRLEERLTSRWLLWIGAAALALSGLFLVNYAVERGLLTPATRVLLALLLGIALTLGGEWVRRKSLPRLLLLRRSDLVAGALTSAGLFVSFAAVYAAQALYGLIAPLFAFLALGAIALVAFALAAVHARIVAILGLLGGFLTPALVPSDAPSAWGLFCYLGLIVVASLAVIRYRDWPWLAFGSMAGAALWTVIWLIGAPQPVDILPLLAFQSLVAAASIFLALDKLEADAPEIWDGLGSIANVEWAAWSAIAAAAILIAASVDALGTTDFNLLLLGVISGAAIYAGRRWQRFDAILVFPILAIILVLALKPIGTEIEAARQEVQGISGPPFEGWIGRAVWPYLMRCLLFAFLIALSGYVALMNAKRPQLWAAASTLGAALLIALSYARLRDVSANRLWALIATGAAVLALVAARSLNDRREDYGSRLALGVYSAAVVAGVSFAFAFVFRDAWLTIALALQLPALAWLDERLALKELRLFALIIASAVLVRLILNPYVLDYEATAQLGAQWILYGYGVPAVAFFAASRLFRRSADDAIVTVLECGALAFALLLIGFEIRLAVEGRIDSPNLTLLELSLQTLVWLLTGWWRARAYIASGRLVDGAYAGVLLVLGLIGVFLGQLIALNPVFTGEGIGKPLVLDKLLLGYLAPAGMLMLIARDLERSEALRSLRPAMLAGALVLAFVWVTLETKHAFQGERIVAWHRSDAEYYAYSVVWLVFAFILLAAGLWRRQAALRHAALAVLLITVLKVFISDMAGLEGLYRVASFLGLGLSLVAIGWIYQRFVYPAAQEQTPASPLP
jgi:uncharacterized membrane protein